jgi:hypothetical protein
MIDWNKAPEGTTHYCGTLWYKQAPEGLFYWSTTGDDWQNSGADDPSYLKGAEARPAPVEQQVAYQTAAGYCSMAMGHMVDRAATYDAPAGERSMAKTVTAFNSLTGHSLTEEQGWLFMEVLKLARSQQGQFRRDNYEDAVAYAALRGEAAEKERRDD